MTAQTLRGALADAVRRLVAAGVADAAGDARRLLSAATQTLAPGADEPISPAAARQFETFIGQRELRVPVSQILGWREFYGRRFQVSGQVLDPRPETECLVEVALRAPFSRVLDLGTGSGCILLTLLAERPGSWGVGIEKSADALRVAMENRDALGLAGPAVLRHGDWYKGVVGAVAPGFPGFDLIVANPPYIAAAEMPALQPEVRDHEPRAALTDEGDGLGAYRAIAAGVMDHLQAGGRLIVEIGASQAAAVTEILAGTGLRDISVHPDLDGRDRVVSALAPAKKPAD